MSRRVPGGLAVNTHHSSCCREELSELGSDGLQSSGLIFTKAFFFFKLGGLSHTLSTATLHFSTKQLLLF